jgi:hypothetical protein
VRVADRGVIGVGIGKRANCARSHPGLHRPISDRGMITAQGAALLSILRKVIVRLHWMPQMGPGRVKTCARQESVDFSLLPSSDSRRQHFWVRFLLTQSIWARVTEVRKWGTGRRRRQRKRMTAVGREPPPEPGTKRMICTANNGGGRLVPISIDCRPHRRAPVSTKSTSLPPHCENRTTRKCSLK